MFRNLTNPDNPLMITMNQVTDCIFLSLFWIVGCIPVVTAGASFAALYDASFRAFRKGEKHSWKRFLHTYRTNWKSSILPTVVFGVIFWALCKGMIAVWNGAVYGEISWMVFSGAAFAAMPVMGALGVLFPMLSRFDNSVSGLLKNTVLLSLVNLPRTLAVGVLNTVALLLCVRFVVPVFFLPSLTMLLDSLFIEPMFKPYLNSEDAA